MIMTARFRDVGVSLLALGLAGSACSQVMGDEAVEPCVTSAALSAPPATTLFNLVVDESGTIYDGAARHTVTPSAAGVQPSSEFAPDPAHSRAVELTGGWLTVTNALNESAADFQFAPGENVTLSFWFKSAGNDTYLADDPLYATRMFAVGFGNVASNFDVDFGDIETTSDSTPPTALWTFWNGHGIPAILDKDETHTPTHYLDNTWHFYELERRDQTVAVRIDHLPLGDTQESQPIGTSDPGNQNYIGRESDIIGRILSQQVPAWPERAALPWFGLLADVRIEATVAELPPVVPPAEPPVAEPPPAMPPTYPAVCLPPTDAPFRHGDLTVSIDTTHCNLDDAVARPLIEAAIKQWDDASSFLSVTFVSGPADITVSFSGDPAHSLGVDGNPRGWGRHIPGDVITGVVELDSADTWYPEMLTGLTAHEFGHALGIEHCNDPSSIMNASVTVQTLDPVSIQAVNALYP
jgi:hypothetical protein